MQWCATCKWWDKSGSPPPTHHRCFRYPPVQIFNGEEPETQWPWTSPADFCGEYSAVTNGKLSHEG
jgi:hypothetical protein